MEGLKMLSQEILTDHSLLEDLRAPELCLDNYSDLPDALIMKLLKMIKDDVLTLTNTSFHEQPLL